MDMNRITHRDILIAMLLDPKYEELQKLCADSRSAAEKGDFEEAHRLFAFARNLLDEESNISGTEYDIRAIRTLIRLSLKVAIRVYR